MRTSITGSALRAASESESDIRERYSRMEVSSPTKAFTITLRISLLRGGHSIMPRREVPSDICPYLHTVMQKALEAIGPMSTENCEVKAHLPQGLKSIACDEDWTDAVREATTTEWMHRELDVIVTLRE